MPNPLSLIRRAGKKATSKQPFYSAVDEAIEALPQETGTAEQMLSQIMKTPGVKKAEMEDRGLAKKILATPKTTKAKLRKIAEKSPPPPVEEKVLPTINDSFIGFDQAEYSGSDYQIPGGTNYREILFKLPESSLFERNFTGSHFSGNKNVLAHARVADRVGPNGEKILHIEEIQSDWHQRGRREGYRKVATAEEQEAADLRSFRADNAYNRRFMELTKNESPGLESHKALLAELKQKRASMTDQNQIDLVNQQMRDLQEQVVSTGTQSTMRALRKKYMDTDAEFLAAATERTAALEAVYALRNPEGLADAPFKKTWHELVLKRLVDDAARNGYDRIIITPGAEQVNRYSGALRKRVDQIEWTRTPEGVQLTGYKGAGTPQDEELRLVLDERMRQLNREINALADTSPSGNWRDLPDPALRQFERLRGERSQISEDRQRLPQRKVVVDTAYKEDILSDALGKAMADKIFKDPNQFGTLSGADLTISDTGMAGFYDRMLPNYLNEFGKKYGARVEPHEISVADDEIRSRGGVPRRVEFPSFPITPALREEITARGVPLYQAAPVGLGTGAAMRDQSQGEQDPLPEEQVPAEFQVGGSVSAELLDRLKKAESGNLGHIDPKTNTLLRSPKGAEGAYQIMPATGRKPGYGVKPLADSSEPSQRIFAGNLLEAYKKNFGGDLEKAVAAYNAGPGRVGRVVRAAGDGDWRAGLPQETKLYLSKVMGPDAMTVAEKPVMEKRKEVIRGAERGPLAGLTSMQRRGIDEIGPGFQAALALSMLGGNALMGAGEDAEDAEDEASAPEAESAKIQLAAMDPYFAFPQKKAGGGTLVPFQSVFYNPEDKSYIDKYSDAYTGYDKQVKDYNTAAEAYNAEIKAGRNPGTFSMSLPALPDQSPEQFNAYVGAAQKRAEAEAGERGLAAKVAADPSAYNFGSWSTGTRFMATGGEVDDDYDTSGVPSFKLDSDVVGAQFDPQAATTAGGQPLAGVRQVSIRRTPNTSTRSSSFSIPMGQMGGMEAKTTVSEKKKKGEGTARQQLEEMSYQMRLADKTLKEKLLGLSAPTFSGVGGLTTDRIGRNRLKVKSFQDGGTAGTTEENPITPEQFRNPFQVLKDLAQKRGPEIFNNARAIFLTGGLPGELLREYGKTQAPINEMTLKGMGIPFKGPVTAPSVEPGFSEATDIRPMGDDRSQLLGELLGDPLNLLAPGVGRGVVTGAKLAGKGAKFVGKEALRKLDNAMLEGRMPGGVGPNFIVKPKGGTFAFSTDEFIKSKRANADLPYLDSIKNKAVYEAKYASDMERYLEEFHALARNADTPNKEAMINMVEGKARNYFTQQFGAPNDPILENILSGKLPAYGPSRGAFRPYALKAAKMEQSSAGFKYPKDREAFEDLVRNYDEGTELYPSLYHGRTSKDDFNYDERGKLISKMDQQIVDFLGPERPDRYPVNIKGVSTYHTDLDRLNQALKNPTAAKGLSPDTMEALRRGNPIWDTRGNYRGLGSEHGSTNFLKPADLIEYMKTVPADELNLKNFPDVVSEAARFNIPRKQVDGVVNDISAGKAVSEETWKIGVTSPMKTYENGNYWVKATDEGGIRINGASVGHCLKLGTKNCNVGLRSASKGGAEAFKSGDTEIYFLKDKRGRPMTTVEITDALTPDARAVRSVKGNGTATGDTAPTNFSSEVVDLLQDLKPSRILESDRYLTNPLQGLKMNLDKGIPWENLSDYR